MNNVRDRRMTKLQRFYDEFIMRIMAGLDRRERLRHLSGRLRQAYYMYTFAPVKPMDIAMVVHTHQ